MKKTLTNLFLIVSLLWTGLAFSQSPKKAIQPGKNLKLWYTQPASKWLEALPLGNGRLGAMVYGGVEEEHLQMNEETLWSGGPHSYDNPNAYQYLAPVREDLKEGKYVEAQNTADKMLGIPQYQMAYQPLGDLFLKFPQTEKSSNYHRELDLQNALSTVTYTIGTAHFKRTVFASQPDQAIVIRLECNKPGMISFDLSMTSLHPSTSKANANNQLLITGQVAPRERKGLTGPWAGEGMKFAAQTKVEADGGTVLSQGEKISIKNANAVTLVYVAATNYVNYQDVSADPLARVNNYLATVKGKTFEQLRQRHVEDYTKLFGRVSIDLGGKASVQDIPTDERLKRVIAGVPDQLLTEQVFQYGRYLMIAGSRVGTQPLNLQGIWNNNISPPWSSKYTININIEMNYWVAEVCNLSELHEPLLRMVEELQAPGRNTAKVHYKANGWVAHHNTDLWRGTAPVDGSQWGMWPTGGAWLCQHLWEHYLYTGDTEFLKKAYPIMKGSAEFFLDVLVEDKDGYLVTSPSMSPEHSHGGEKKDALSDGRNGPSIIAGPTMDLEILRDLFANCIEASKTLNIDNDFRAKVVKTQARLAPLKIGKHGQLQEWPEDWDNPSDQHSHVSHLYGLFPSNQINRYDTPELFEAAKTSLIQRGFTNGWSGAWRISLWARVGNGDKSIIAVNNYMQTLSPNLFNGTKFQIDADFGVTAGIAEMLLQSQGGEINLLPALPTTWPTGSIKGLRGRGGLEVDIEWKDNKLVKATIRADKDVKFRIANQGAQKGILSMKKGETKVWTGN